MNDFRLVIDVCILLCCILLFCYNFFLLIFFSYGSHLLIYFYLNEYLYLEWYTVKSIILLGPSTKILNFGYIILWWILNIMVWFVVNFKYHGKGNSNIVYRKFTQNSGGTVDPLKLLYGFLLVVGFTHL